MKELNNNTNKNDNMNNTKGENMNKQQMTDEELIKQILEEQAPEQKESIFRKVKNTLSSDTAKEIYQALAIGTLQGLIAGAIATKVMNTDFNTDTLEIEE